MSGVHFFGGINILSLSEAELYIARKYRVLARILDRVLQSLVYFSRLRGAFGEGTRANHDCSEFTHLIPHQQGGSVVHCYPDTAVIYDWSVGFTRNVARDNTTVGGVRNSCPELQALPIPPVDI